MPRKPKDLLSQSTIVVSERDRQIYHEVMIVGRSQRAVAAKFGLSQQRISKIVNRTSVWMSETAPYGLVVTSIEKGARAGQESALKRGPLQRVLPLSFGMRVLELRKGWKDVDGGALRTDSAEGID